MANKVLITGSTGMVGKGVLLECLDNPEISDVLVVNRRPVGINHPKLKEVLLPDFFNVRVISRELRGYDACFFCLGVSSAEMKEAKYKTLTYDLTMAFAKTFLAENPESTFCYVSGAGTDSSEKGRMMWARIKGKTENDLLGMGFKAAYMFRPGFIEPKRGIKSGTPLYNSLYIILWPLVKIFSLFPSISTNSIILGQAMIRILLKGYPKNILESRDINVLGN